MITLHFGIHADAVEAATATGAVHRPPGTGRQAHPIITDNDGWNAWGEPVGEDENDDTTVHMILTTNKPRAAVAYIRGTFGSSLVPMGGPATQAGILIAASDSEDWSQDYPEFTVRVPRTRKIG